jgi:glycosyltransferase involved in cell wall biosynthesis
MRIFYFHNAEVGQHTANLTQVISMCKAFAQNGAEVILCLPQPSEMSSEEINAKLTEVYQIENSFKLEFLKTPIKQFRLKKFTNHLFIRKLLKKYNPDFCFTRDVNFLNIFVANGIPTFYESHNFKIHQGSIIINNLLKRILLRNAKNCKLIKIITISNKLAEFWKKEGIEESKLLSLHDGFSKKKYEKILEIEDARKQIKIPQNDFVAMYTGNLFPNRGVNTILKLAQEFPKIKFYIIGGPLKYQTILEQNAKEDNLQNVKFVGQVPFNKIHLYQFAANINLGIWSNKVPTINYCSPLKIFEYMAVERPIVAMGFPTIIEVLKNGKNAFISNPEDFDDLKKIFREAIDNPDIATEYAKKARKEALEKYTWQKRTAQIIAMYKDR